MIRGHPVCPWTRAVARALAPGMVHGCGPSPGRPPKPPAAGPGESPQVILSGFQWPARALVWFTGVLTGPGTEYGSLVRALARASGMVHDSGQRPGRQVWCRCVGGGPGGVGCALVRAAARAGVDGSRVCGAQKNSRESLDSRLIPNYLPVFPSVSVAPILPTLTP